MPLLRTSRLFNRGNHLRPASSLTADMHRRQALTGTQRTTTHLRRRLLHAALFSGVRGLAYAIGASLGGSVTGTFIWWITTN